MEKAEEKAIELIEIFGKDLAEKCVDEILTSWFYKPNESLGNSGMYELRGSKVRFYTEVKTAIQNYKPQKPKLWKKKEN